MAAEDLRFGEHSKRGVFREGCGEDIGEFSLVAGRVQELGAVALCVVEGSPFDVAVAEDCSGQVGVLKVGVGEGAVLEKRAPHGRCGCVDVGEAGVADAGVVQPSTAQGYSAQVQVCLFGSYGPAT